MSEPFWNLTNGVRPREPIPGLFASICEDMGHVYDEHYGPLVCARCGHQEPAAKRPRRRWGLRARVEDAGFAVNRRA